MIQNYNSEKYDTVNVECQIIQWVVYAARVEVIRNLYNILPETTWEILYYNRITIFK